MPESRCRTRQLSSRHAFNAPNDAGSDLSEYRQAESCTAAPRAYENRKCRCGASPRGIATSRTDYGRRCPRPSIPRTMGLKIRKPTRIPEDTSERTRFPNRSGGRGQPAHSWPLLSVAHPISMPLFHIVAPGLSYFGGSNGMQFTSTAGLEVEKVSLTFYWRGRSGGGANPSYICPRKKRPACLTGPSWSAIS